MITLKWWPMKTDDDEGGFRCFQSGWPLMKSSDSLFRYFYPYY